MTASGANPSSRRLSWLRVPWPVLLVAGLMVAGLLAVSGAYGFHGDEMYYVVAGQHPAFGYVDQPPLTPLLSAASVALLGVSPMAVRLLPALEMALIVVLIALIARDVGGSRRAQVLAAITAALSGYLGAGHLDTTTDPDLLAWAVILWFLVRLLAGGDRRLWLALGVVTGIGLENKDTLLFLGAGLAVGLVLASRWDVVRSPWAWAAIGIALLLCAPNLVWQATNGWPQITMARAIAGYAADNRAQVVPLLWLFSGPLLFPVSAAGLVWVLVAREAAPWRPIGIAALVALVLAYLTGGKAYYAIGSAPVFMAAGAILLDRWLARGHIRVKFAGFGTAAVLSGALIVYLTLPILPVATFAKSSLPATVPDTANQIGWPQFVATVEGVVASLPAQERAHAVILTNDYSEASPLVLMGKDLPPVYSGHNAFWDWGPPPADRTVVVHVGDWRPADYSDYFVGCHDVAHIDNGLGIQNGEQGEAVTVCTGLRAPWTTLWPGLRTIS
ncbi:MAG TPA: glycosyltransferase family 39 protein [Candidatus Baltobacteraceae bacterium]|nr:glycosyltransferase family 39 protein [Candidatus Baltobacteraceae bacterium]